MARLLALVLVLACGSSSLVHARQARTRIAGGASLPATCALQDLFALTAGDIGTHECIATNTWRKIHGSSGGGYMEFHPSDYGAVCNGSTDDSTALQDTFDAANTANGGTVILPASTCNFSTPLIIGGNSVAGPYSHLNIKGQGEDVSRLNFTGLDSGSDVALFFKHVGYFRAEQFSVSGPANTKTHAGTTVGIKLGDVSGSGGTMTLSGTFDHVSISGFYIGMLAGDSDAASEIDCNRCQFNYNNYGWSASGYNSLNFWFYGVGLGFNGVGMQMGAIGGGGSVSDGPRVYGGHAAANDIDFAWGNAFGETIINGFRSEGAGLFLSGNPGVLIVDGVTVNESANVNRRLIDLEAGSVAIRNSVLLGNYRHKLGNQSNVELVGTQLEMSDEAMPIELITNSSGFGDMRLSIRGNTHRNNSTAKTKTVPDYTGYVFLSQHAISYVADIRHSYDASTYRSNGGISLSAAKSIGFGTTVAGKNLRDTTTFATSATSAFTFSRTLTVTLNGTTTVTATTGTFKASDIGKKIVVTNGTDDCGYAGGGGGPEDLLAFVASVTDSTHVVLRMGPILETDNCHPTPRNTAGLTLTIGENEPDANYFVVGIACDTTGETFKWGSLATTGFTLTSSNASSTATCNFLIVR